MHVRTWGLVVCLVSTLPNTVLAQTTGFDSEYIKGLTSLTSLVRRLIRGVDSLVADESAAQLERRTKRLSQSLFDLCAKKRRLIGSLEDAGATPDDVTEDAYNIQETLKTVQADYTKFGAVLSQRAYRDYERVISNGLSAKAIDINAFIYATDLSESDRTALKANIKGAESLCVEVQKNTADLAVRLHEDRMR